MMAIDDCVLRPGWFKRYWRRKETTGVGVADWASQVGAAERQLPLDMTIGHNKGLAGPCSASLPFLES